MRLFVGIYPPQQSAPFLFETLDSLTLPPHKIVPLEQLHLTVHFIGEVVSRDIDRTIESVSRSVAGLKSFSLSPLNLISLPRRGRARLMAIETDRPSALLEIQRRLVSRLARNARLPNPRFCSSQHNWEGQ